ncbi:MAG: flagellar biosynthetic protein FliO [Gammaproteobacteria bacterium]|nr:flagellar biosynthetic protein FliO [Gammaproteobacteria bacterium]
MRYLLSGPWQLISRNVAAIAFALLLFPQLLMAAEPGRSVASAVSVSQIINLLAGLVLVLLVFFAVIFLLKRLSGLNGLNKGHIKIVDAMHLSTKERLLIVKVTNEYLLLGLSPQGIHPLHVLNDDFIENDGQDDKKAPLVFNQLLSRMKTRGN